MKTKVKRLSKRTLAMFLGVIMLITCLFVGSIPAYAWNNTTWYLGNDIAKVWDNSASNCTMTKSGTVKFYYDLYLKTTDADVYYRPYEKDNYAMGPTAGNNTKVTTTGTAGSGYNDTRCWYFDTADCTANKYNKIRIWIDTSGNNGNGWSWYEKTAINNISPTLSVPSTGTVNTAITLTGGSTDANKIGTLTKTYQYSTDNGSTWTDLASGSYTASSAGTVKFRYKVSDAGVKTSGSGTNGRTARVEYSSEQSCTFSVPTTNYTGITAVAKGTTDGTNYSVSLGTIQSSTTVSSSTGLAVNAGTQSGYTFYKWVASGSGTFDDANNASTTFHPAANSEVATAQFKKNYTFSNGTTDTHGTVTIPSGTKKAGDSYSGTVTPADGYKIKTLTVGGNAVSAAVGKTSAYTYSGTTGSSTTGTTTPISVVATFEANTSMNLYIAGRFRVRPSAGSSSWTTTYSGTGDWNATSTNIPFTYLSGTTYKVDTYASLAELSAKIGSSSYTGDPVFFVYDTTNSKNWYASSATTMSTTGTTLVSSGGANSNLKFSSTSSDSPVTIYYDTNTHKIWYTIPDFYDVTVNTATGGTVTASPTRAESGTTVTLTIAPSTGYQLSSITAKDASNATVTLSGSGNSRTFTMPAKNVTVTPAFSKITWSGLTAVGKYSTTGASGSYTNTWSSGGPNVTIASTSATQLDGVAVTAPATDPTGYVFAGWITNNGSFANAANKDTTFKPNAANAQAVATYKKIYTITSSVDNTGTGAGTVTTSKTSVEAGGSYTITATAKSGSAVESVKVNGTAKTATASQTISSVSADQSVVVKFKSNVYLRGGSTIGTNWTTGDAMTSNADGTEFTKTYENVAGSSSGTQYQFKLYVNGYNNDGTATINITGGTSTGTCTHQSSGDQNYVLTLKKAANVTVKSNGTKITEIKVVPANSTKYAVTFKKVANTTITGSYEGTNFSTGSADATVQVYEGDEISFTVTPASGKYISSLTGAVFTPSFSKSDEAKTYKITNVTAAKTITPAASGLFSVAGKTNKSSRGTITVSPETAYPGQTVTITVTEKNGQLKSLSYTYTNTSGNTVTTAINITNSTAVKPTETFAPLLFNDKKSTKLLTSAGFAKLTTGANNKTFTVPNDVNSAITVNAIFDPYSAESTWYYNGYTTSGTQQTGYHSKQMTEGMVGGEKFSYYHVEGRTGTDQLFTVSDGLVSSGTRYVYFTQLKSGGWDYSHSPHAYFMGASNSWPGGEMTWYTDNDMGQPVYRIAIPTGATGVVFNDNGTHKSTDINDLSAGGYYVDEYSTWDGSNSVHTGHTYACSYPDAGTTSSGTEYFYDSEMYTADFSTKGFYNHNANNKTFVKPKDLGTNTGDYYVNVLYAGKTYTINGVTKTVGAKNLVIWSTEPLAGDDETTTIYAKDGSIRSETYGSTYANIADTKIYAADGTTTVGTKHNGNITNQTYETYKATKGDTIIIKTQIGATDSGTLSDAADLKAKYYVRGFCVNGEVSQLLEWNADGLYTLTYKVPEDEDISKIEITPIYYLKDTEANPIVTYRVTGFTDELKQVGSGKPGWGDTLYTYPYYGKLGSNNNALGAYPGQPMVYYKGQYQMQIPQKSTAWDIYLSDAALSSGTDAQKKTQVANTSVSGVTMSNGYYDIVHRQIMGYGSNGTSADHVQTYDYGDFYKIFNEKKPVDNIVFDFKYETKKHNFENQPAASVTKSTLDTNYGTNGNGFELLTNFHGRHVDLFGTALSGDAADPSKTTPVYVVSIGGVNGSAGVENIAGYYATEWMVYGSSNGTNYTRITAGNKNSIPPEVLVLNDDDNTSFNTTTYPSADANHTVNDWKALYTALEAYRGKPVMISYEAADAQIGAGNYATSGGGGATRNDGRWLYSKNGETITSNIKIQYSDDNGETYTDLNTTTPQVPGLSAYFTNDGVEGEQTYTTTIDPDKTFDFEAKTTNGNYKFVGWFMEDGTKITTDNVAHTERSGSYTFVAKFMQVTTGQLILSHSVDTNTTYKGAGTAKISAVVKNGEEVVRTYDLSTSDITLDDKIIKSDNSNYTIEVTLEATATGNDTYENTVLANPSGQEAKFYKNPSTTTVDKTNTIVLDSFTVGDLFTNGTTQNVKNIIYHSYFNQAVFNYTVTFSYNDRTGAAKSYTRQGKLSSNQAANESYVSDNNGGTKKLLPAFIKTIAPHVSNFGQTITWSFDNSGYAFTNSGSTYTCTASISATQTSSNKRDVTFVLPYEHTNGVATLDSNGIGTYASETVNFALTGNNAVTFESIPKLLNGDENHIFDENGKKNWIAAPKVIKDGDTPKFFKYWTIKTTSGRDVAKCYFNGFNYAALDNYVVTAEYDTVQTSSVDSDIFTDATYLETSRNQWNDNKDRDKTKSAYAADLLLNDFIVNYNYKGVDIYKADDSSAAVKELGIVVERIQELDTKQDGSKDTTISKYTELAQNIDTVKAVINGTSSDKKFTKHSIEKTALDNKNRYQVYDAFYNGAGWSLEKQTSAAKYTYKNYVYRIYSYMKYTEGGETKIALAEIPSYFTMYDEATKSYPLS